MGREGQEWDRTARQAGEGESRWRAICHPKPERCCFLGTRGCPAGERGWAGKSGGRTPAAQGRRLSPRLAFAEGRRFLSDQSRRKDLSDRLPPGERLQQPDAAGGAERGPCESSPSAPRRMHPNPAAPAMESVSERVTQAQARPGVRSAQRGWWSRPVILALLGG